MRVRFLGSVHLPRLGVLEELPHVIVEVLTFGVGDVTELSLLDHPLPRFQKPRPPSLLVEMVDQTRLFLSQNDPPAILDRVCGDHLRMNVFSGIQGQSSHFTLFSTSYRQSDCVHIRIRENVLVSRVNGDLVWTIQLRKSSVVKPFYRIADGRNPIALDRQKHRHPLVDGAGTEPNESNSNLIHSLYSPATEALSCNRFGLHHLRLGKPGKHFSNCAEHRVCVFRHISC